MKFMRNILLILFISFISLLSVANEHTSSDAHFEISKQLWNKLQNDWYDPLKRQHYSKELNTLSFLQVNLVFEDKEHINLATNFFTNNWFAANQSLIIYFYSHVEEDYTHIVSGLKLTEKPILKWWQSYYDDTDPALRPKLPAIIGF